jgi:hypothetical protein
LTVTRSENRDRFTTHLLHWPRGKAAKPGCSSEELGAGRALPERATGRGLSLR